MSSNGDVLIGNAAARAVHGWSAGADLAVLGGRPTVELASALRTLMVTGLEVGAKGQPSAALDQLADLASTSDAVPIVIGTADLSTSAVALLDLLDKPGVRTAVITTTPDPAVRGLESLTPARVGADGRLVESVGTAMHVVTRPTHVLPGLLRVAGADRPAAARLWREAARGTADQQIDPFSLAVVTLVRGGIPVQSAPLGPYAWSRTGMSVPGCAGSPWQQRLSGSSRGGDGFFSTYAVRPISRRLTRVGLALGWSPNMVTLASLACGLLAAALVASDQRWAWVVAAVMIQVALVLDCVDGEIARFTRQFSALGAWLDAVGDRVKEYTIFAALALVAVRRGDQAWVLATVAMALLTVRHLENYAYLDRLAPLRESRPDVIPLEHPRDLGGAVDRTTFAAPPTRRSRLIHWAKSIIHLPIAERALLISLGLLTFQPLVVLWVMVVGVAVAMLYTQGGRTLIALLGRDRSPPSQAHGQESQGRSWGNLDQQADLGPLARLSGRLVRLPLPAATVGVVVLYLVVLASSIGRRPGMSLACAVAAAVLLGAASRPPLEHPLAWQVPALLWLAEVLVLTIVTSTYADGGRRGMGFAFLAAVAYHRYDVVYRLRDTGAAPAAWLSLFGLGVEGRIIVVLAVTVWSPAALEQLLWAGALYLAVVYTVESAVGWRRWSRTPHPSAEKSPMVGVGA